MPLPLIKIARARHPTRDRDDRERPANPENPVCPGCGLPVLPRGWSITSGLCWWCEFPRSCR